MRAGSSEACAMAAFDETTPSSVAERALREPPNAPNGVRFAATIKMPDMMGLLLWETERKVTGVGSCSRLFVGRLVVSRVERRTVLMASINASRDLC